MLEELELPVLVAPMAGGVSTPALVTAAAEEGAAGFLPLGYLSPAAAEDAIRSVAKAGVRYGVNIFVPRPPPADASEVLAYRERLRPEAEHYGVELPAPRLRDDDHYDSKVELTVGAAPAWVSFTFGIPDLRIVAALRRAGSTVLVTVTDTDDARRAVAAGADALIVQGGDAGGHSATTRPGAFRGDRGALEVLREVRAAVDVPLVAAGGVGAAADVRALIAAGAVAVQSGTSFLLAAEAGTRPAHRAALGTAGPTVLTRAFSGHPARALPNRFTETYGRYAPIAYPAVHHLTAGLRAAAAAAGDAEALNLWAGAAYRQARPGTVREILERLSPGQ